MIALRDHNFRLYWIGQAVSNIGNWMQVVALGWFILQLFNSPFALGLLGLVQFLPVLLLSLAGGVLADRFLRLHLLILTQSTAMILALILASLAFLGHPPLWSLLLIASISAAVTAIDNPARQAFLSDLVGKNLLLSAVALNASIYNGAAVIGPTLAGLLLLRVGAASCFLINGISFLAVISVLVIISFTKADLGKFKQEPSSGHHSFTILVREIGSLRYQLAILVVLGIAAVISLLGRPYLLLMPAFAKEIQHVGPQGLGLMVAASGLGSLAGALLLASLSSLKRLEHLLLITGVCFGIALLIFALSSYYPFALVALVVCGAGATMTMMVANTLLQISSPAAMKGRVMSLYTLIAAGLTPLGAFIITSFATRIGLTGATVSAGVAILVVVVCGHQFIYPKHP